MRAIPAMILGFVAAGLPTAAYRVWPRQERTGWFELAGTPVALDSVPVEDWEHVNDLLARPVADLRQRIDALAVASAHGGLPEAEFFERAFEITFRPDGDGPVQCALVRRYLSTALAWGGRRHPTSYARHEVVRVEPVGR